MSDSNASLKEELAGLIYDNPDLERLEALLDDFNPFEAMRWTRQEVRHSSFLRWLLDPLETHGLGAYCLRSFAKRIAYRASGPQNGEPTVFDIDGFLFSRTEVLQEWNNIDILVRDDEEHFILVIENKVDSGEHSNQLQRYREIIQEQYPGYRVLYAFLTVAGVEPSDENYIPIDYAELAELVADTVRRRKDQLGDEVRAFMLQYGQMIRRNIVEESEIQQLCRSIYANHKRALDVIFEHKPDKALDVSEALKAELQKRHGLVFDHSAKSFLSFIPESLDILPRDGYGWTPSKRVMLFMLDNYAGKITFRIGLGPGLQETREDVHTAIAQHPDLFNRAKTKMGKQYWSFHSELLVGVKRYEELEAADIAVMAFHKLDHLLPDLVPKTVEVLSPFAE